jgi:hypothetical protein
MVEFDGLAMVYKLGCCTVEFSSINQNNKSWHQDIMYIHFKKNNDPLSLKSFFVVFYAYRAWFNADYRYKPTYLKPVFNLFFVDVFGTRK